MPCAEIRLDPNIRSKTLASSKNDNFFHLVEYTFRAALCVKYKCYDGIRYKCFENTF